MPTEIRMPELSSDMTEADLVQWLVAVGDTIAAGELGHVGSMNAATGDIIK